MRKVLILTFVISVFSFGRVWAFAPPLSGSYTINSAVATSGTNYQTFTEAVLALQSGVSGPVVFNVKAGSGPYNEQVVINPVPGASTTNTVLFNCNGVTLTFNSSNSLQRAGIKLDGAHHIIFDSLTVVPQVVDFTSYGYGFHLIRDADSNIIRKCTVINTFNGDAIGNAPQNTSGIVINGNDEDGNGVSLCDANLVTGNTITGGYYGIVLNSLDYNLLPTVITMNNNQVTNNIITNAWSAGITLLWGNNTLIAGNDISGSFRSNYCDGIQLNEISYSTMVKGNRIHHFRLDPTAPYPGWRYGIGVDYCIAVAGRENVLANNLVYDFDSPEEFQGISLSGTTAFCNIYHNTVSFNNPVSTTTTITGLYLKDKTLSHLSIQNNIFAVNGGAGTKQAFYSQYWVPQSFFDRNDYYATAASGTVRVAKITGTSFTTLAAMQNAMVRDFHSVAADPVFTNITTDNYLPTSAMIDNRGIYVGISDDITGAARSTSSPDMGAYEMLSTACSAPPVAGTTVIYPSTSVCINSTVALELTGNSAGAGQIYQWQSCTTATGAFTNVGTASGSPGINITASTNLFYRAQVTCGGNSVYSNPVQLFVNSYLPSGAYTINAAQPTAGTNFKSFNDAVLSLHCGIAGPVTFNVTPGSGPYTEQVILKYVPNTSAANTVTFNGNGETLRYTSTNTNSRDVFKLDSADYIILDSLKITATGAASTEYGWGVHLMNNADNNIIRRCTITASVVATTNSFIGVIINGNAVTPAAADISYCDSNQVINNTITGGYYSILVSSNSDSDKVIHNVVLKGNTCNDAANTGIYTLGVDSIIIEGNDIARPVRNNSSSFYGVATWAGTSRYRISKNRIHNFCGNYPTATGTLYGIYCTGAPGTATSPNTVSNNLLYDFNGATTQYAIYNSNGAYTRYYHNTISMDDSTHTSTKASNGFYQTGTVDGIEVKNNIFTVRRTNTAINYVINMRSTITYVSDYNDFLVGNTGYTKLGYINGNAYAALADWQTGATQDAHSLAIDPAFTAPASGNFKPAASTAATTALNDKGTPVGIPDDVVNFTRSTTVPDMGAYEFGCSAFPGAAIASDSITVCTGDPVSFAIQTPAAGVSYSWYNVASGGAPVFVGNPYNIASVTTPIEFWVSAATAIGCTNGLRTHVKAVAYGKLAAPVAVADTLGVDMIRFKWTAVAGATGYLVSRDGVNFTTPSSGVTGLTHTITGLRPLDTAGIVVKAIGVTNCQEAVSARVSGRTRSNEFFIPNTFTPNGDGRNDVFRVYGNTIKTIHVMVFNQWGEKVFETSGVTEGWDGSYKGKQAPIGVYMYVVSLSLNDGTIAVKKGSLNLVR